MGLAGYHRRFTEGFSKIVSPLTQLTRNDHSFTWMEQCERSLKLKMLTNALVLTILDINQLSMFSVILPIKDWVVC